MNIDLKPTELFSEELEMLDKELSAIDDLYDEIKTHFDKVKNSSFNGGGALTFVNKQTPSIIDLKKTKISIIKEKIDLKKIISDLDIKKKQLEDGDGTDEKYVAIAKGIYENIINDKKEIVKKNRIEEEKLKTEINEDVDKRLEERLQKIKEKKNKKEDKKPKFKLVCDIEGNIYPVDDEYNILENIDESYYSNILLHYSQDENGNIEKAFDQNNNEIEIVNID